MSSILSPTISFSSSTPSVSVPGIQVPVAIASLDQTSETASEIVNTMSTSLTQTISAQSVSSSLAPTILAPRISSSLKSMSLDTGSKVNIVGHAATVSTSKGNVQIGLLSDDNFKVIFSNCTQCDLQSVASVSRTMSSSVIGAANVNEPDFIKKFMQFLIQNLDSKTFAVQRKSLTEVLQKIISGNFANLLLMKKYILEMKNQLFNVIITLDSATINNLKKCVKPPKFMEDIFELAVIERQIDEANLIEDRLERSSTLQVICQKLIKLRNIDRAIAVAMTIPNEIYKSSTLQDICKELIKLRKIDRAIAVAMAIPNVISKSSTLQVICKELIKAGNIDDAIAVAMAIPDEDYKTLALQDICKELIKVRNIDRAIAVAATIPNKISKTTTLQLLL